MDRAKSSSRALTSPVDERSHRKEASQLEDYSLFAWRLRNVQIVQTVLLTPTNSLEPFGNTDRVLVSVAGAPTARCKGTGNDNFAECRAGLLNSSASERAMADRPAAPVMAVLMSRG